MDLAKLQNGSDVRGVALAGVHAAALPRALKPAGD